MYVVQFCDSINFVLIVFNLKWKIRIEPGLFEWTGHIGIPFWIAPDLLASQGYPIDTTYVPQVPINKLIEDETVEELYKRSSKSTQQILSNHKQEGKIFTPCTLYSLLIRSTHVNFKTIK